MVLHVKGCVLIQFVEVICVKGNCFIYASEAFREPAACIMKYEDTTIYRLKAYTLLRSIQVAVTLALLKIGALPIRIRESA